MGQILMPCCTYGSAELDSITATASDIREGKTSVDQDGEIVNGALADKKNWSSDNLSAGTSITIPAGIHNGSGKVTAKSLADQTQGTAVASDILKNKTAVVNGTKITGTMANIASVDPAKSVVLYNNNLYARMTNGAHITNTTAGYPEVSMTQAVVANAIGLKADAITTDKTILGVTGTRPYINKLGTVILNKSITFKDTSWNISADDPGTYMANISSTTAPYAILRVQLISDDSSDNGGGYHSWVAIGVDTYRRLTICTNDNSLSYYVTLFLFRKKNGDIYYKTCKGSTSGTYTIKIIVLAGTNCNMSQWDS